ncbi:serine-threonine protein kinase [Nocardia sp. NPDC052278]|uniref:serine-threonine protein kinase n=1 Tax=unclassified Nocardia TaxID=2637762 RepID=UPI00368F7714
MPEFVGDKPLWIVSFDKDGDVDRDGADALVAGVRQRGLTDLIVFSHGWNNDRSKAVDLYQRWFGKLDTLPSAATRRIGYAGVIWPSERWSDEPIGDFAPAVAPTGAAAARRRDSVPAGSPTLDADTLQMLKATFPDGAQQLDRIAELLGTEKPNPGTIDELFRQMREFSIATFPGSTDSEGPKDNADTGFPAMLSTNNDASEVFRDFAMELMRSGVDLDSAQGGAAGIGDIFGKVLRGAKEALRALTYWQMKNRAGVVGENGLGPLLGRLHREFPSLRINLIGHSFGARVVSYALAGLPDGLVPSPVKSVTLLQGAFSSFAFADPLPFDRNRRGGLAGRSNRVDGPVSVCFSSHDGALNNFYPLASKVAGDNAAGAHGDNPWTAMGAVGAFEVTQVELRGVGDDYPFTAGELINIDASDTVVNGQPPFGAHSDIVHENLAWVVVKASKLDTP